MIYIVKDFKKDIEDLILNDDNFFKVLNRVKLPDNENKPMNFDNMTIEQAIQKMKDNRYKVVEIKEDKNTIYLMRDIDDQSIMVGNQRAIVDYAEYLNNDYADDDEDKIDIKCFDDALEVIKSKRIIVAEIDTRFLDNVNFNVFHEIM